LGSVRGKRGGLAEKGGIDERHELQTLRNRRTSMRVSRLLPIIDNSSVGRSDDHFPLSPISFFLRNEGIMVQA
jgi:hypothetical protein